LVRPGNDALAITAMPQELPEEETAAPLMSPALLVTNPPLFDQPQSKLILPIGSWLE
jgi:hypothetical protein